MWVRYNAGAKYYEYSNDNGASFFPLPLTAASITDGTFADARLSANVPLLNAVNTFTNYLQQAMNTPAIIVVDTSQAANLRRFQFRNSAQLFLLEATNDAGAIASTPFLSNRSGDVQIGRDLYVVRQAILTGGQIQFPGTQVPSGGANVLDDYEEGAWTPTDTSGAGLVLGGGGTYYKIGRTCRVYGQVIYPATANVAAAAVGGLPFVSPANNVVSIGYSSYDVRGWGPAAVSYFHFLDPATNALKTNAQITGGNFVFCVSYDTGV